MQKQIVQTNAAPAPIGPYSQAVLAGGMLYISGQIALSATDGTLTIGDIREETEVIMHNLKAILSAAGAGFEHVVKTTIFLLDMSSFAEVNEVYGRYFPENPPARETVAVRGLPRGVNVEISMIAAV